MTEKKIANLILVHTHFLFNSFFLLKIFMQVPANIWLLFHVIDVNIFVSDGKLYQEKVQSILCLRQSSSEGKSTCSSVLSLSPAPFIEIQAEGNAVCTLSDQGSQLIYVYITFLCLYTKWDVHTTWLKKIWLVATWYYKITLWLKNLSRIRLTLGKIQSTYF